MSASVRPVLAAFPASRAPLVAYRPPVAGPVRAPYAGALDAPLGATQRARPRGGRAPTVAACVAAALCGWTLYADPVAHERAARILAPFTDALFPPAPALVAGDLQARRGELDGQTILYVEGVERNVTKKAQKAQTVRVALLGEDGRALYSWTTRPATLDVGAEGAAPFRARLLSPPPFRAIAITLIDGRR